MKSFSFLELKSYLLELKKIESSQINSIFLNKNKLSIQLSKNKKFFFLCFDLSLSSPLVFLSDKNPCFEKTQIKPIVLFFKSHFLMKKIKKIKIKADLERILIIEIERDHFLEIALIPHKTNFILNHEDKKISFRKRSTHSKPSKNFSQKIRDLDEIKEGINKTYFSKNEVSELKKNSSQIRQKKDKKLEKLMKVIKLQIEKKEKLLWKEAGECLKLNACFKKCKKFHDYYDLKKPIYFNVEKSFKKHKKEMDQVKKLKNRLKEVKKQKDILIKSSDKDLLKKEKPVYLTSQKKEISYLLDSQIRLHIGKNLKENKELLKKAKPWHLWIHLKDKPSAYALLSKNRKDQIQYSLIKKASFLLMEHTYKKKIKDSRFEVILTEVRFVSLIKKDPIGRVTYRNEKVFSFNILH